MTISQREIENKILKSVDRRGVWQWLIKIYSTPYEKPSKTYFNGFYFCPLCGAGSKAFVSVILAITDNKSI